MATLIEDKDNFRTRIIIRDKEELLIINKPIYQENSIILNVYGTKIHKIHGVKSDIIIRTN